jgi:hypothetical protein
MDRFQKLLSSCRAQGFSPVAIIVIMALERVGLAGIFLCALVGLSSCRIFCRLWDAWRNTVCCCWPLGEEEGDEE